MPKKAITQLPREDDYIFVVERIVKQRIRKAKHFLFVFFLYWPFLILICHAQLNLLITGESGIPNQVGRLAGKVR